MAGYLECLFLYFHVGGFALTAGLVQRAVVIYALAGGAAGAAIGLLARRVGRAAEDAEEVVAAAFAAVLAAFVAAFLLAYLLGLKFALRKLSLPALARLGRGGRPSLLAFLVLSRLCGKAAGRVGAWRPKGLLRPVAVAAATVSLGLLAAPTLVALRGGNGTARPGVGARPSQPNLLVIVLDAGAARLLLLLRRLAEAHAESGRSGRGGPALPACLLDFELVNPGAHLALFRALPLESRRARGHEPGRREGSSPRRDPRRKRLGDSEFL